MFSIQKSEFNAQIYDQLASCLVKLDESYHVYNL